MKTFTAIIGLTGLLLTASFLSSASNQPAKSPAPPPRQAVAAVKAPPAEPPPPPPPSCKTDWKLCADNSDMANNWDGWSWVSSRCKTTASDMAKYGSPEFPWFVAFTSFLKGDTYVKTGIATAIENDAKFQNGFGAMVRSRVVCQYDLRTEKVIDVKISGR